MAQLDWALIIALLALPLGLPYLRWQAVRARGVQPAKSKSK
jgi:hypothetical protein